MDPYLEFFNVRSLQVCHTDTDNVTRPGDGAAPDFPTSIVCFEQLEDRCSLHEVAAAAEKPSVSAITTGEAQHRQALDSSAFGVENVADLLK
jgi:hypothetical protein